MMRRRPMTVDLISNDLKTILRRLKLGPMLDTLPERLTLARQQKMPLQDFLLLVLGDEVARRDSQAATVRAQRGRLDHVDMAVFAGKLADALCLGYVMPAHVDGVQAHQQLRWLDQFVGDHQARQGLHVLDVG